MKLKIQDMRWENKSPYLFPWRFKKKWCRSGVWGRFGSVFKSFQFFPRTVYYYSLSLSTESHPNTLCHSLQPPLLHLFTSKSARKRYGLLFCHLISCILSFIFVSICVGVLIVVMGLFRCFWDCSCLDY